MSETNMLRPLRLLLFSVVAFGMGSQAICAQVPAFVDQKAEVIAEYCQGIANGKERADELKRVCEFSLTVQQKLPNYICDERMERSGPYGPTGRDVIEAQVTIVDGLESYSNIRKDGQASDKDLPEMKGMASTGEFGSQLQRLFAPENKTKFKFKKEVTLNSKPALLFSFDLTEDDNHSFKVWDVDGSKTHPGYKGSLWVDKSTLRPMRLETTSKPTRFRAPFADVKFETEYGEVPLADESTFLLPVKASVNACTTGMCFRNKLEFANCHKFGAKARILAVE